MAPMHLFLRCVSLGLAAFSVSLAQQTLACIFISSPTAVEVHSLESYSAIRSHQRLAAEACEEGPRDQLAPPVPPMLSILPRLLLWCFFWRMLQAF